MRASATAAAVGVVVMLVVLLNSSGAGAWSNGGFSSDPTHPDYGTHDWIAQHALDWLPLSEKTYILDDLAAYLYGTELPDNGGAPDGIGDTALHHVYYYSDGSLQDDASAVRASEEFQAAKAYLLAAEYPMAAKTAGILSHYIVDPAVFGHVMGAYTDWGAEVHHADYEDYVTARMTTYTSAVFDPYLRFDGALDDVTAYNATLDVGYDTTFGDSAGTQSCVWMDANYDWTDPMFADSAGASLNRAVNALADVLHTLALETRGNLPAPDTVPPTIRIVTPINGATVSTLILSVSGTASDNVALQKVELSTDGSTWLLASGMSSWSGALDLGDGPHTIYAKATDTTGNMAITSITVTDHIQPSASQAPSLGTAGMVGVGIVVAAAVVAGILVLRRRRPGRGR